MTSLEILDIARNKLTTLPPELVKLTSLKVMAVGKNRLETLPLYIADMAALQVLKLEANPIKFPPKEIFDVQQLHLDTHQPSDGDIDDIALTLRIKRFLRETQRHIAEGMETESSTSSLILPTDSGYVSFGKSKDVNFQNENEDVRSILTDNENIAFEPGTKQQLISAFTYEIFQSLGDFFNDKHESSMRVIDALPELLKDFSIELRDGAAPGVQQNTAVFVRHHRT
jgi:Leucine-rich repeat (LRR) protein